MSEPIRILQVFAQMGRGGAETMIMNLYRTIDKEKVQFDFIVHTGEKCEFDDEIKRLGGKIYSVPRYTGRNHFQYIKAWNDFFKNNREYRIIHGHVRSTASIYLRIAKKYGLTTIIHSHSTSSGKGIQAHIKNILQLKIRKIADCFIACSDISGKWLYGAKTCENKNYRVINNGIMCEQFIHSENIRKLKRSEFNIGDRIVIGHIGSFIATKNHKFIIDIFQNIHDREPACVLMLVGEGELLQEIKAKVMDLGLQDHVIFTGLRSDISELLQAMDVFVFPSIYEGLPVTLIEAQAAGLPCIISNTISSQVKITDLVFTESLDMSAKHWADQVLKYYKETKRRNTYDEIVKAGFDIKDVAAKMQAFYISLIK